MTPRKMILALLDPLPGSMMDAARGLIGFMILLAWFALLVAGCATPGPRVLHPSEVEPVYWDWRGNSGPDSVVVTSDSTHVEVE